MDPFHMAHLLVLGIWLGVQSLRAAARFHYTVDKFGELPILAAVLGTGTILTVRAWPLTPLHIIKIAASPISVAAALVCVLWVFRRRDVDDVNALLGFRRRIWTLASVAAVFAIPALYVGLAYFRE